MSLVYSFDADDKMALRLAGALDADVGVMEHRQFPDGETYIRFDSDCKDKNIVLVCCLHEPNAKVVPLLLACGILRDLGAASIGLVTPYLAYMRQDIQFRKGEGITARYFGKLLSDHFDWLVTVDPHLHRIHSLDEVYSIPTQVVAAAPSIASYIRDEIKNPLLIGPDSESAQWVSDVARRADAPYKVLEKVRAGDRDVSITVPGLADYKQCVPVLIDDIVSTGNTMATTVKQLIEQQMAPPVCISVHGVFAEGAVELLRNSGADRVITCNTIADSTNAIDLVEDLADGCRQFCG